MTSVPRAEVPDSAVAANVPAARSALASGSSHLRLWLVAGIGIAADLWAKEWAFRALGPEEHRSLLNGWLTMRLSLNPGALFGLGVGFAPLFVGASVLALMFTVYLFAHSAPQHRSMHVALGLVLAGAAGNLYDRTQVRAYAWFDPATGQRHIGALVRETPQAVTIGDFMTGRNPRVHARTAATIAGWRPVVRDFLQFEVRLGGRLLWPWVFNVADALLVIGVGVLLLNFWLDHRREGAGVR